MKSFKEKLGYICDMDGVIYHGDQLLKGAKEFVGWLEKENKKFLFLTNNVNPDYVIIGETYNYNYEAICQAVHHVRNGAKLCGETESPDDAHRSKAPGGAFP